MFKSISKSIYYKNGEESYTSKKFDYDFILENGGGIIIENGVKVEKKINNQVLKKYLEKRNTKILPSLFRENTLTLENLRKKPSPHKLNRDIIKTELNKQTITELRYNAKQLKLDIKSKNRLKLVNEIKKELQKYI